MPQVTILVPNYRTLKLTKLCLRLIRKYTDPTLAKVIVIDNHSEDESIEYLRTLKWITLIEREPEADDNPPLSHSRALDLALQQVDTPYVLSIHSDTIVKRTDWLIFLLKHLKNNPILGALGSWKLENKPWFKRLLKAIERCIQLAWCSIRKKRDHAIQGTGKNHHYLRSHCALFRMDLIRKFNLTFSAEPGPAGKAMCQRLQEEGYQCLFLPSDILCKYIDHLNHATAILNPELGARKKTIKKGAVRIKKVLKQIHADEVLRDGNLDN